MKPGRRPLSFWLPLFAPVVLAGCSSSSSSPAVADTGTDDTLVADTALPGDDADGAVDPNTPYEHAVMAASWTVLPTGPKVAGGAKQDDVFFTSPSVGYAASGPKSALFQTTDGGATWKNVFTHTGTFFRAVHFLDDKHGFAGNLGTGLTTSIDDPTIIYETLDSGATWKGVDTAKIAGYPTDPAVGVCNFAAVDDKHVFAVGRANGPAYIFASSDAGATWTTWDLTAQMSMLIDAHFTSPTEGIVAGQNAGTPAVCTIVHTADGGKTWDKVFSSTTRNGLCWKLSFPSDKVGYVSVQDEAVGPPTFGKTTDGGKTWVEMPLPLIADNPKKGYPAIGIGFITDNVGWVAPEDATMPAYRTTDGGVTWTVDDALEAPINRFRFVDKKTAYAIGASVWKLSIDWTSP